MPLCFSHSAGSLKEYLSNVSIFASKLFICNRIITFSYKYRCPVRCKVTITYNREQVFPYIFTSPRFSWSLIYEKHRGFAPRSGRVAQKSDTGNTKKDPFCGLPKINYLYIVMYKQLTSEQRSQIFALLQRKSPRKEIAHIVGISQSTLSRELKRNGSPSGKYVWFKAHDKAMERRKRSTSNAALAPELVWRIKQAIIGEQWSPRQISGCRVKHPNASSTEKYNNFALAG